MVRAKRYKRKTNNEATSVGTNDFSITRRMVALQIIDLLDKDKYLKVVEKLTTLEWKEISMNILNERKRP